METPTETIDEVEKVFSEPDHTSLEYSEAYVKQYKLRDVKREKTWPVEAEQEQPNVSMFPVASTDEEFLERTRRSMVCVDHDQMEQLNVQGRSSSPAGRSLMIEFFPCLGGYEKDCLLVEDVRTELNNANLVVLHNLIKFDQDKFGAESIVKESRII